MIWKDDCQVVDSHVYKRYSDKDSGYIRLKVYPYQEKLSLISHIEKYPTIKKNLIVG